MKIAHAPHLNRTFIGAKLFTVAATYVAYFLLVSTLEANMPSSPPAIPPAKLAISIVEKTGATNNIRTRVAREPIVEIKERVQPMPFGLLPRQGQVLIQEVIESEDEKRITVVSRWVTLPEFVDSTDRNANRKLELPSANGKKPKAAAKVVQIPDSLAPVLTPKSCPPPPRAGWKVWIKRKFLGKRKR